MPRRKKKPNPKKEAGRLGGLATVKKHGPEHMSRIGKRGAATTWTRYSKKPYGLTQYAMVSRTTNKIIRIIGRAPNMESILED